MYLQLSQGFHELLLYIIPPDSSKLKTKEPLKKKVINKVSVKV